MFSPKRVSNLGRLTVVYFQDFEEIFFTFSKKVWLKVSALSENIRAARSKGKEY